MLMAYLMDEGRLTPTEAQAKLSAVRPHVSPRLWRRPSVRELHRRAQQRALMAQQAQAQAQAQASSVPPPGTQPPGGSSEQQ